MAEVFISDDEIADALILGEPLIQAKVQTKELVRMEPDTLDTTQSAPYCEDQDTKQMCRPLKLAIERTRQSVQLMQDRPLATVAGVAGDYLTQGYAENELAVRQLRSNPEYAPFFEP